MTPKKRRLTIADLRPIALTDVSYKIVMKVLKEGIERHLEESGMVKWEQAGFTKGGEILDNLMVLHQSAGTGKVFSKKYSIFQFVRSKIHVNIGGK